MTSRRIVALAHLLVTLLLALAVAAHVSAKAPVLGSMSQADAGLTVVAALEAPVAVDGIDGNGRPLFAAPDAASVFLAVDVRALKGNKNGFGAGEFVPYLSMSYRLRRQGGGEVGQGQLHPVVTPEGVRYGNNLTLPGPGSYAVTLAVEPPIKVGFGRHTDLETGVSRWWSPFEVEWRFTHAGEKGRR